MIPMKANLINLNVMQIMIAMETTPLSVTMVNGINPRANAVCLCVFVLFIYYLLFFVCFLPNYDLSLENDFLSSNSS